MASSWIVEFQTDAYKEFRQLDNSVRVQAIRVVQDLAEEPFPEDSIALRGYPGLYRISLLWGRLPHLVQGVREAKKGDRFSRAPACVGVRRRTAA